MNGIACCSYTNSRHINISPGSTSNKPGTPGMFSNDDTCADHIQLAHRDDRVVSRKVLAVAAQSQVQLGQRPAMNAAEEPMPSQADALSCWAPACLVSRSSSLCAYRSQQKCPQPRVLWVSPHTSWPSDPWPFDSASHPQGPIPARSASPWYSAPRPPSPASW